MADPTQQPGRWTRRRWTRGLALGLGGLGGLGLAGCATAPASDAPAPEPPPGLDFGPPREPPDGAAALRPSPAMLDHVDRVLRPASHRDGAAVALGRSLTRQGALHVEYDSTRTRTAAEAFEARSGNCLSLVLMTAALADALNLPVDFREVLQDNQWSRLAGLYVASGHVNLALGPRLPTHGSGYRQHQRWIVDFLPAEDVLGQPYRYRSRAQILGLYLNNRAAEWLLQGDLDSAHAWAWAALAQAPDTGPAYTTLGVVYLRHGDLSAAESLLRQGLARHPDHPPLLANLAQALVRQGRAADAATVSDRLAQVEGRAPFADLQRGMAALRAGDAAEARRLFLRELARDPDYHEFHFALALAEARLGQPAVALRHLQLASDHSPQAGLRTLYSAKADHLREALAR